ncbi:MAG: hypothetical protein U0175_18765 [Caldilineaceae bacterium]
MPKGRSLLFIFFSLFFLGALPFWSGSLRPAEAATPALVTDTPQNVTYEALTEWWMSNGLLYWTYNCSIPVDEFRNAGYARRQPTSGGTPLTLASFEREACINFRSMMADASGLYYYNGDASPSHIEFRPSGSPNSPMTIYNASGVDGRHIRISGDYLYWIENHSRIVRVKKDGSDFAEIATGLTDAYDFVIVEARQEVYWMETSGLWKTNYFCGSLPCNKTFQAAANNGGGLLLVTADFGNFSIYWPDRGDGGKIVSFFCGIEFCSTSTAYPSPSSATVTWDIGTPATDGTSLFWQEVGYDQTTFTYNARIRRMTNGIAQTIVENLNTINAYPVYADQNFVYFYDTKRVTGPQGIRKIATSASVFARDVAISNIEVTQGIQNLANDVPLVVEKPTYVRVMGKQISGQNAMAVEATLAGMRDGSPLPGSPLRPIGRLPQFQVGAPFSRDNASSTWLFELPLAWRSGEVALTFMADPRNAQSDPNLTNNSQNFAVSFLNKAPLCVVLIPVRTHTPDLLDTTTFDPIMAPTLDLATRMMPVSELWPFYSFNPVEEWPGGQYAPFEMDEDSLNVLTAVNTRAVFTSNPKVCKAIHAGTNYVGIISQAGNQGNKNGGMGHLGLDSSWTALSARLAPGATAPATPYWPYSGQTFAHELGHNFSRLHVNCGGPSGNDLFYPYDNSLFAPGSATGYYGFDPLTKTSIAPQVGSSKVADLMSYCPPRWPSDYTWRSMMNKLSDRPLVASAGQTEALLAGSTVYVSGYISPTGGAGALNTAWVFANSALGSDLFGKWQGLNANFVHARGVHSHGVTGVHTDTFHLRLLDGNNQLLSDQPVTPSDNDNHGGPVTAKLFALTFAAPAGKVARLELRNGDNLLAATSPGGALPTVAIFKPAGGETITDTLSASWQADDADSGDTLISTVQYSPDNGQTWVALLINYPVQHGQGNSVKIDPASLPGSAANQALLRVSVSDGYNTAVATSNPFTLTNRKPIVTVFSPGDGALQTPEQVVSLRGIAVDPEEGGLGDSAHTWQIDGQPVGTGKEIEIWGVAPGTHEAKLSATDSLNANGSATATLTVAPLVVPLGGDQPTLDGLCNDSLYSGAALIPLAAYTNLEQAYVQLVRDSTSLWVCFSGLLTDTLPVNSAAMLMVDGNHSGESQAQSDDYRFVVDENGGVGTYAGDGAGGFAAVGPGGLQGMVNFPMAGYWNAEMRIDANMLGSWGHQIGLAVSHQAVNAADSNHSWPRTAQFVQPSTWGTTVLGTQPQISSLDPVTATMGSAAIPLLITGQNFNADAVVLWNGQALSTTYFSATTLQAMIGATQLANAADIHVQVSNPDNGDSLPASFIVEAPLPAITTLTPNTVQEGADKFTLTIQGNHFLAGAEALWNGEVLSTTVVSSSQIKAEVSAAQVERANPASVVVVNPQPGGYNSNVLEFTITAKPVEKKIFLPLLNR